jgi:hypothetical protein
MPGKHSRRRGQHYWACRFDEDPSGALWCRSGKPIPVTTLLQQGFFWAAHGPLNVAMSGAQIYPPAGAAMSDSDPCRSGKKFNYPAYCYLYAINGLLVASSVNGPTYSHGQFADRLGFRYGQAAGEVR